jgi:thermitase
VVIDTGVDYTHSDLAGKVFFGRNCIFNNFDPFDDAGHGTHVAGLAAATAGNGQDGEGVSHLSKIYATMVFNSFGFGTFFQIACGMHDAHLAVTSPPIRVGNMSIGGPASALIATEVDHWKAAGKLLVVAAGNDTNTGEGTFNIDPDIALRVMATEEHDCRTDFSNFSPADGTLGGGSVWA